MRRATLATGGVLGAAAASYYLVVTGKATVDIGLGRLNRPLGPFAIDVDAPAEVVFDVIAAPYLGRTPQAMADKLRVVERGTDMVLAEHYTPLYGGRVIATTLETVTFTRPERVGFRLVRGPVPHVTEEFALDEVDGRTTLGYSGELGTDGGAIGMWWGNTVARVWEAAVRSSFEGIRAEAERRARAR